MKIWGPLTTQNVLYYIFIYLYLNIYIVIFFIYGTYIKIFRTKCQIKPKQRNVKKLFKPLSNRSLSTIYVYILVKQKISRYFRKLYVFSHKSYLTELRSLIVIIFYFELTMEYGVGIILIIYISYIILILIVLYYISKYSTS